VPLGLILARGLFLERQWVSMRGTCAGRKAGSGLIYAMADRL